MDPWINECKVTEIVVARAHCTTFMESLTGSLQTRGGLGGHKTEQESSFQQPVLVNTHAARAEDSNCKKRLRSLSCLSGRKAHDAPNDEAIAAPSRTRT